MRIALAQGGKHQPAMGSGHCAGEMGSRMKMPDVKTGPCRSCNTPQIVVGASVARCRGLGVCPNISMPAS